MASIPLPALDIKPPAAPPDPIQQYGNLLALKNSMQEQPIRQQILSQQATAGQQQNQLQGQQIKDQQAMTSAMQNWDGKDINGLVPLVIKNGASANAVMGLKSKILEQQQSYSKIAADDATTGSKNLETAKGKNDMAAGRLGAVLALPDDQLAQGLATAAQELGQNGTIDPAHAQGALQLAQSGDPKAIRSQLAIIEKGLMGQSAQIAQAQKDIQLQESGRHDQALEDQAAASLANTQQNDRAMRQQGAQRIGIDAARLAFERAKSGIGANGQPSDIATAIASGHVVPERMAYLLSRNPEIVDQVMKLDPSFDSSKAQAYPQTYKDFTSGKTAVALNAGGTALGHLQELRNMNTVASHIPGTADYNAYQNKVDTLATELAKFYGDSTVSGIESIRKTLASQLPGTRDAAIKTQAQSMGDKFDAYQQQWLNAAPSKAYQAPMPGISPQAQAARSSLAGGGTAISVTAPNGKAYSFKDQAAADAFKKNAGIQ